jgi:hypothetical protein
MVRKRVSDTDHRPLSTGSLRKLAKDVVDQLLRIRMVHIVVSDAYDSRRSYLSSDVAENVSSLPDPVCQQLLGMHGTDEV